MWKVVGLNCQNEWIEEHSCELVRRVITPALPITEEKNKSSLRFGRLSSAEDYNVFLKYISKPTVFKSYGHLSKAFDVWGVASLGKNFPQFKTDVEQEMARQVWLAFFKNKWHDDLPTWSLMLDRLGPNGWPFAIDLFLNTLFPHPLSFSDYIAQSPSWASRTKGLGTKTIRFNKWQIFVSDKILLRDTDLSVDMLKKPSVPSHPTWSNEYKSFSGNISDGGFIDPLLNQAIWSAMKDVSAQTIQDDLDFLPASALSFDQKDAVWMALAQLAAGKSFLLSDDTGYGKGRVLAAVCRYALLNDIQVLFVTEKKALFSDFYRDCLEIFPDVPPLNLLHSTAKVFSQDNKKVAANIIKEPSKEKWVWTTYSQFNRENKAKQKAILQWMKKPTWVILDEAQNAAGQSNTFKSFGLFNKKAKGVLYSSATFAKREEQLEAYRLLFSGSQEEWTKLKHSFGKSYSTRSAITLDFAQEGSYIRRQHPPMDLPVPIWVEQNKSAQTSFVAWWQAMYFGAKELGKMTNETPWKKIGAMLARAQREFSMLQKISTLKETIEESLQKKEKVVVVSDWTLSSHMARLLDHQKMTTAETDDEVSFDDEGAITLKEDVVFREKPLWKDSWALLVEELFPKEIHWNKTILFAKQNALEHLKSLPNWGVSPFDDLKRMLQKSGTKVGEISGRSWQLSEEGDVHVVTTRDADARVQTVHDFNNGSTDVVLITRAGNSGTSLHAGQKFKNQNIRHLIEWDVPPDPSVRLQFWGRVRRRDQIHEPVRSTLLEDTLYEKRRYKIDQVKQKKLLAHSGSWQSSSRSHLWEELILKRWAIENPKPAAVLGYYEETSLHTVLGRAVILKDADQEKLSRAVSVGLDLLSPLDQHLNAWEEESVSTQKSWWSGRGSSALFWHDKVWPLRLSASKEAVAFELKNTTLSKESGLAWPEQSPWKDLRQGSGVLVTDPQTGERVQAIVLGFEKGSAGFVTDKIEIWLSTWTKKITTSIFALVHPKILNGEFLSKFADVSSFNAKSFALRASVLVGPAWAVAAWGEQNAPDGELLQIQEKDGFSWGWRLPQSFSFADALSLDRPLSDANHAFLFMKHHSSEELVVKWKGFQVKIKPQSDGIFAESDTKSFANCVSFPVRKKINHLEFSKNSVKWIIPWSSSRYILGVWEKTGASFNVKTHYFAWSQKTWPTL